ADDYSVGTTGSLQRGILGITGLVTEDSAEQLFFRGGVAFAFRSDLTDQDIAFLDLGADADDTVLVQVFGGFFRYVGDVRGQLFFTQLGVTNFQLIFGDVYRSEQVFLHHFLADNDGIL